MQNCLKRHVLAHCMITSPHWRVQSVEITRQGRLLHADLISLLGCRRTSYFVQPYINGLVQGRHNSSALAMELRLFCINPSTWWSHDMETLSASLVLCDGNPLVTNGFASQRASDTELWCFFSFQPIATPRTTEEDHFMLGWSQWITYLCLLQDAW